MIAPFGERSQFRRQVPERRLDLGAERLLKDLPMFGFRGPAMSRGAALELGDVGRLALALFLALIFGHGGPTFRGWCCDYRVGSWPRSAGFVGIIYRYTVFIVKADVLLQPHTKVQNRVLGL